MKRKISLILCVLCLSLCFVGCSGKSKDAISEDQLNESTVVSEYLFELAFQYSGDEAYEELTEMNTYELETLIYEINQELGLSSFSLEEYLEMAAAYCQQTYGEVTEEMLAQYEQMYYANIAGKPSEIAIEPDVLLNVVGSLRALVDECGKITKADDIFVAEVNKSTIKVAKEISLEDRNATITFTFDDELNVESMDASADYTTGEILKKAGLNTLLGMGTVFAVLIFLAFIISLMKYIPMFMGRISKKDDTKEVATVKTENVETVVEEDDLELIAVIAAAIAASEGTSTDGFVVRSIRRRPSNYWN